MPKTIKKDRKNRGKKSEVKNTCCLSVHDSIESRLARLRKHQ